MINESRLVASVVFTVLLALGCCGAVLAGASRLPRATISPILVRLLPGAGQRFTVEIERHCARPVKWLVNDIAGGNSEVGKITRDGIYKAPAPPPLPNEVHIEAIVDGAENRCLWSTVLIGQNVPSYRLIARWGEYGEGPCQFLEAHGIALDADGNLLIADTVRSRVSRFTPEGKLLGELGLGPGSAPGAFKSPPDVQAGPDGHILVLDRANGRIQEFTRVGQVVKAWGQAGAGPGQFHRPHSIALGKGGRTYVADTDNNRIQVFDRDGKFLFAWTTGVAGSDKPGTPHGVAADRNGDVFVTDFYTGCQKFTADGKLLFAFAANSERYHALCSDRWGDVYLMARHPAFGPSIVKYNNNGAYVTRFALVRPGSAGFYPKCAVVDDKGRIYVTESDQHNIAVDVLDPE
jgi:hypothetical protein